MAGLNSERHWVKTVIVPLMLLVFFKGILFAGLTPGWSGDDEQAYWADIMSVVGEGSNFQGKSATPHGRVYPTLVAPLYLAAGGLTPEQQLFAVRVAGGLFYAALIYLTYLTARALWPRSRFIQGTAVILIAFNPKLSFMMSSVSTDVLLLAVFSAWLYALTLFLLQPGVRRGVAVVALLLLGAWTKRRFLVAFPLSLAAWAATAVPDLMSRLRERAEKHRDTMIVAGVVLTGAAIWLMPRMLEIASPRLGRIGTAALTYDPKVIELWGQSHFQLRMFRQYIGFFVSPYGIQLSTTIYKLFGLLLIAALAGLAWRLYRAVAGAVSLTSGHEAGGSSLSIKSLSSADIGRGLAIALQVAAVLMVFQATGAYETYGPLALGRYLLVAAVPAAVLLAAGLEALVPRRIQGPALWSLAGGAVMLNLSAITVFLMGWLY